MLNLKLFYKKKEQVYTDYYSTTLYTEQLKEYYKKVTIEPGVAIRNPGYIHIDDSVVIGAFSSIVAINEHVGQKYTPIMKIGRGTSIGFYGAIGVSNKIIIGENVMIAGYVQINDTNHCYEDITKPIAHQPVYSNGPIIIEDDCWIGLGSHILGGVTIGKHSVVGANSVVTKSIPPFSVAVGVPAKVVKQYNFDSKKWENVPR